MVDEISLVMGFVPMKDKCGDGMFGFEILMRL